MHKTTSTREVSLKRKPLDPSNLLITLVTFIVLPSGITSSVVEVIDFLSNQAGETRHISQLTAASYGRNVSNTSHSSHNYTSHCSKAITIRSIYAFQQAHSCEQAGQTAQGSFILLALPAGPDVPPEQITLMIAVHIPQETKAGHTAQSKPECPFRAQTERRLSKARSWNTSSRHSTFI